MRAMKFALPDTHNPPSTFSERTRYHFVAPDIAVELTLPEFEATLRCVCKFASFMSVPETSVDENGYFLPWKNKIRLAEHMCISSPAINAMLSKDRDHPQFCVSVAASANAGHDFRALFACENVSHSLGLLLRL
jgi:hypothetical protein